MKKLAIPALAVLSAALAITLFFGRLAAAKLLEENHALRAELESAKTSQANNIAQNSNRSAENAPDPELIRLRGEVTTLRQEKKELEHARAEIQTLRVAQQQTQAQLAEAQNTPATQQQKAPRNLPRESWSFAGYNDPESAIQSVLWAGFSGNAEALVSSLTPEQFARMQNEDNRTRTPTQVLERLSQQISKVKAFQVLQSERISADETVLTLYLDGLEGSEQTPRMKMQRVGETWRLAGPYRPQDAGKGQ